MEDNSFCQYERELLELYRKDSKAEDYRIKTITRLYELKCDRLLKYKRNNATIR